MKKSALICILLAGFSSKSFGEPLTNEQKAAAAERIVAVLQGTKTAAAGNAGLLANSLRQQTNALQTLLAIAQAQAPTTPDPQLAARALVPVMEAARVDKQVGSTSGDSGATNLVSKGSLPEVLGFAVEHGALTRSINGTAITFQGSPSGILDALRNKGFLEGYQDDANVAILKALRRTGFSVTFDTSRDAVASGAAPFTASARQVAAYSFRVALQDRRDPRDPSYTGLWKEVADGTLTAATLVANRIQTRLAQMRTDAALNMALTAWEAPYLAAVTAAANAAALRPIVDQAIADLETVLGGDFETSFGEFDVYTAAVGRFAADRNRVLREVARSSLATYAFNNTRQVGVPDLLNHMLIYETDLFGNGRADFTINGSFSHFSSGVNLPEGQNHIRDYQFGAQLDLPVAGFATAPNGIFENWMFTASWRYMRLLEPQKIPGIDLTAPSGVVNLFQGKLTVPVKDGVKIPFAVTVSNRSELVPNKRDVRFNLGVLFDSGVLFSRLKP